MENEKFSREIPLIGEDAFLRLRSARVILFGVGGVGGYILEALVRAGIGSITVVDNDTVSTSNVNRQILATESTIGMKKTDAAIKRAKDIDPDIKINAIEQFYLPENADSIELSGYDYVIDAIDTLTAKLELAKRAEANGIPFISCMGTANKLDAEGFCVTDIYKTEGCPLARAMRTSARKLGLKPFKVVYSKKSSEAVVVATENGRHVPASISFVPPVAGFIAAGEVIKDITKRSH